MNTQEIKNTEKMPKLSLQMKVNVIKCPFCDEEMKAFDIVAKKGEDIVRYGCKNAHGADRFLSQVLVKVKK